ncbi:hypothetical protein Bxe_A0032 [Paraburkholderia xenovorans LB400]|uniref:Uncharacterized protein n=1 Tax=Paraburkholderia xenovorans (strain LB400) TaxID=266265 RepID=Q13SP4_PARXL|nr:hypothetical protein Bxe_A0032 [Paraburkholderia xenovorans LB400]
MSKSCARLSIRAHRSPLTRHRPLCPLAQAKIDVCCIFETSAATLKRPVDGRELTPSKPHVLVHPYSLTFDVFRLARRLLPHREEAFHAGY